MIVQVRLIKRITDDGLMEIRDEVELGRLYRVDMATRHTMRLLHDSGAVHEKEMIRCYPPGNGWLPVALLEFLGAP